MKNVSIREYSTAKDIDVTEAGALIIAGNRVLFGLIVTNLYDSPLYFKLYNKATTPTVGTDTIKMTIALPGTSISTIPIEGGIPFSLGIGVGATKGVADADATATGSNKVIATFLYK